MITQENIEHLTVFAEQHFCKNCTTNPCKIFTSGEYEKCPSCLQAFEKQESEYHNFLASVQKPFIPGKCVCCRNEEMNDKDTDYKLVTIRNHDGTIKMRGYLCAYHRTQGWVSS